jgi:hypothetical protein
MRILATTLLLGCSSTTNIIVGAGGPETGEDSVSIDTALDDVATDSQAVDSGFVDAGSDATDANHPIGVFTFPVCGMDGCTRLKDGNAVLTDDAKAQGARTPTGSATRATLDLIVDTSSLSCAGNVTIRLESMSASGPGPITSVPVKPGDTIVPIDVTFVESSPPIRITLSATTSTCGTLTAKTSPLRFFK